MFSLLYAQRRPGTMAPAREEANSAEQKSHKLAWGTRMPASIAENALEGAKDGAIFGAAAGLVLYIVMFVSRKLKK
jgi:hypothetical protein